MLVLLFPQALPTRFNRAMLMNIGYAEASKQANYSCYIFHDVDLLPEDDRNIYNCPEQPRHMSAAIDKFSYKYEQFTSASYLCSWEGEGDPHHSAVCSSFFIGYISIRLSLVPDLLRFCFIPSSHLNIRLPFRLLQPSSVCFTYYLCRGPI